MSVSERQSLFTDESHSSQDWNIHEYFVLQNQLTKLNQIYLLSITVVFLKIQIILSSFHLFYLRLKLYFKNVVSTQRLRQNILKSVVLRSDTFIGGRRRRCRSKRRISRRGACVRLAQRAETARRKTVAQELERGARQVQVERRFDSQVPLDFLKNRCTGP